MGDHAFFEFENFALECGVTLPVAKLAFETLGTLNAAGDNAIVYCSHFGATHNECQFLIGADKPLDPARHFIILTNLSGKGLTSSPDNTPAPFDGPRFPLMTIRDNVRLQHALVSHLGVKSVALVMGHSMGALQAYEWAASYPDLVRALAPICGAARVSGHNTAFLLGLKAVMQNDPVFNDGHYTEAPEQALRTVGRVWSAWAPTHGFYRAEAYKGLGFASVEAFLSDFWEETYAGFDANNMMSQIDTWLHADIGSNPAHGGFEAALAAITARAIVMPSQTDAYFPPEDGAIEARHMPNAEFRPIPSTWGHWAGSGRNADDNAFIGRAVSELLD